ncbi:MAG: MarR family transcriptional regulator [Sphingobacteriaceae bacterium]|nr:MarR family transcriptional regulator [Sphingobacteriaceae bacterium]
MGIQEDIKQRKAFRNDYQKAAVNILYTYNWLTEGLKQLVEPYDITLQQYNVLRILRGSHPEPLTTLEIRNRMLDKMSDVSRIVDRMITKDLVSKSICPKDKRLVDVEITEKGIELLKRLKKLERDMDQQLERLTPEEANQLSLLLDKLRG